MTEFLREFVVPVLILCALGLVFYVFWSLVVYHESTCYIRGDIVKEIKDKREAGEEAWYTPHHEKCVHKIALFYGPLYWMIRATAEDREFVRIVPEELKKEEV